VKVEIGVLQVRLGELDKREEAVRHSRPQLQACPACAASLMTAGHSVRLFDEAAHEEHVRGVLDSLASERTMAEQRISKLQTFLQREAQVEEEIAACLRRRTERLATVAQLGTQKITLEYQLSQIASAVRTHKAALVQQQKLVTQVAEVTTTVDALAMQLNQLQDECILWSAVKSVFSPTGFIAYSLEDVIADINVASANYLETLSQGTITYKLVSSTADGRAKISHQIVMNGVEVSLGSLSGGEERAVILAVDFGIADVLVQRANTQLPSVLMLDECLEGLDPVGKEKVLDALREISRDRCILVIDHSSEMMAMFDQVIKVSKKNEISKVEV
jgi:DNA repair exonuclease SbcCD ATPase subunit